MYYASVTLHVLAAIFWLGGLVFVAVVAAPVLRQVEPESLRARLFEELGVRFRATAWLARISAALAVVLVAAAVRLPRP